jgi:hypothetical protein
MSRPHLGYSNYYWIRQDQKKAKAKAKAAQLQLPAPPPELEEELGELEPQKTEPPPIIQTPSIPPAPQESTALSKPFLWTSQPSLGSDNN